MSRRRQQVADTIQRILGESIQKELRDPRIGFATVVGVEVSADLRYAWVRVSVMGDAAQQAETMAGLKSALGFLRHRLAEEMNYLRAVPELRLELDTSLEERMRIDALLRSIAEERSRANQTTPTTPDDH